MQTENKKGFQVKDLIVTALLSLCALVIYILCAFLSFSPYTMLVVSPLWSLLAAIHFLCDNRHLWILSAHDNLLHYCWHYFCVDRVENRLH